MKFLYDFLPILVFFIAYKCFGIYVATALSVLTSLAQVSWTYFYLRRRPETMHLITFLLIMILGGATLFFQNELFIKWKTTAVYWALGSAFLLSQFFAKKPLVEHMMGDAIQLPKQIWARLNISWALFSYIMGSLNLWVLYNFDTDTWVNFKLYGTLGLTVIFALLQAFALSKHSKNFSQDEK
jgi:intracellular septation protein